VLLLLAGSRVRARPAADAGRYDARRAPVSGRSCGCAKDSGPPERPTGTTRSWWRPRRCPMQLGLPPAGDRPRVDARV